MPLARFKASLTGDTRNSRRSGSHPPGFAVGFPALPSRSSLYISSTTLLLYFSQKTMPLSRGERDKSAKSAQAEGKLPVQRPWTIRKRILGKDRQPLHGTWRRKIYCIAGDRLKGGRAPLSGIPIYSAESASACRLCLQAGRKKRCQPPVFSGLGRRSAAKPRLLGRRHWAFSPLARPRPGHAGGTFYAIAPPVSLFGWRRRQGILIPSPNCKNIRDHERTCGVSPGAEAKKPPSARNRRRHWAHWAVKCRTSPGYCFAAAKWRRKLRSASSRTSF